MRARSRPPTEAELCLLAFLEERPEITEHIVKRFMEASERRSGGHVLIDVRFYNHVIEEAEVAARLKVGRSQSPS